MSARPLALALFLFCLPALRAESAAPPSDGEPDQTRMQIDHIFKQRDHPTPLPAEMRNPFLRPGERSASTAPAMNIGLPDSQLLELLAPTIQVRGIVETAGRFGIIVNRKIYYEGDNLPVEYNAGTVEIEVRRITGNTYTFAYKGAEITQRLAN